MARSHGVVKTEIWEPTSDLRRRSLSAQWCYVMLISQPQINNCGIVPYVPEKWVRYAADLNSGTLDEALAELEQHRFIVVDHDAGELLVRTFIKHDRVWRQPNLIVSARKQHREIESDRIRQILAQLHPWLEDTRPAAAVRTFEEDRPTEPLPEPLFEGVTEPLRGEPLPEPLPKGVNARTHARAHAQPQPLPQPLPQRDHPQGDLSLGDDTRAKPTTPQQAASPATNGNHRPAIDVALDRIHNIGAELPASHLRADITDALGPRTTELDDDDWITLTETHADILAGATQ